MNGNLGYFQIRKMKIVFLTELMTGLSAINITFGNKNRFPVKRILIGDRPTIPT